MTTWDDLTLTPEHARVLAAAAITPEVADRAMIHSVRSPAELPAELASWGSLFTSGIAFPWVTPAGDVVVQVRPDTPLVWDGEDHKYLWPRDVGAVLNAARPVRPEHDTVLIIEGTKQTWAAAGYAPDNCAVYGVGGCRNWSSAGIPLYDLMVVEDKRVVVVLDADAKRNLDVYSAGMSIAEACAAEGASSVKFLRLPASGTAGLDDVLGARPEHTRAGWLNRQIGLAKTKPADVRPAAKRVPVKVEVPPPDPSRPRVFMDPDRLLVINEVTQALLDRWNAVRMFDHGGVISLLSDERRPGGRTAPVLMTLDRRSLTDLVQETIESVRSGPKGELVHCYPEAPTLDAVFSRYRLFAPIDRVARVPFVRRDGTICQTQGYDEASATYLSLDPDMGSIQVPDDPTPDDLAWAVKLIREEWLYDFFQNMPDEASRTNTVALALTPFVRGLMPIVPMAVIDGLQMGVGKNLLADVALAIPATGDAVEPMNWDTQDDSENRKQITSAFKDGADVYVFDEAHRLHGASLARVITAATWKDRNLGHSQMLGFANRVTWVSLGNNVEVAGDIVRRVYRIALRPDVPDPQDRPSSAFRIPDIRRWTLQHRTEIIAAVLTLVRAWFAAGQPSPKETSFGSFEGWERVVGGILAHAGFTDFLANTALWRRESNYDQQHWDAHVAWLWERFGDQAFSTSQVREALLRGGALEGVEAPPGLTDLTGPATDYNRALGKAYGRFNGVHFGGIKLLKAEQMMHRKVQGWRVYGPTDGAKGTGTCENVTGEGVEGETLQGTSGPVGDPKGTGTCGNVESGAISGGREGVEVSQPPTREKKTTLLGPAGDAHTHVVTRGAGGGSHTSEPSQPSEIAFPQVPVPLEPVEGSPGHRRVTGQSATPSTPAQPSEIAFPQVPVPLGVGGRVDYERLDPDDFAAAASVQLPEGVVVFDIETGSAADLFTAGPEFVKIAGYQVGDGLKVTEGIEGMATLLRHADKIVGHNIMNFDLLPFALHHGFDIHQAAADGRLHDTQLAEVLINPPPFWMEPSRVPANYKLEKLGQDKFGVGKSGDLGALIKRHGGNPKHDFDVIPHDDADYVRYCAADVDLTARLAVTQRRTPALADYMRREHRIAAIAAQITMNGVKVDTELLGERYLAGDTRKRQLRERLMADYGMPRTTKGGAPAKGLTEAGRAAIERAFNDLGVELPRSASGKGPATGAEVMRDITETHAGRPEVVELAETVQSFNGVRTVYGSALEALHPDGRVHTSINMYQATGRWSVTNPGMTVFGKRGGRHVEREIFIADEGEVMISADLSQVDARAIAAWSQDLEYLAMFAPGMDLHAEVALQMLGDRAHREQAKALSHGYNYGLGFHKLAAAHGDHLARTFLDTMATRFPRLVAWKAEIKQEAIDAGYVLDNGWGRRLMINPDRVHTQSAAHVGQSAARDIMMEGLLRLPRWVLPMLRVQVHDEIVLSVPEDRVDEVRGVLQDALSFPWRPFNGTRGHTVPVDIIGEAGPAAPSWGGVYAK
jgi:DNA polymerase I-like protein with 3'-5' exonuclease and polymerase domains